MKQLPAIRMDRGIPTLYVKGEPFFALSGEIHNSSASNAEFMEQKVWPKLREMHMNTCIVPLYWELIEEIEGDYNYSSIDSLVSQARENEMHLIFLWFGLWKNGESMYVPGWMKRDTDTYYRVQKISGERLNTISPLCKAAVDKDALAFSVVMKYIREIDEDTNTVIMMQVENEIGILGSGRDYGEASSIAFEKQLPEILSSSAGKNGNWKESFGEDAEEFFMAYYFASAVEQITAAGQKEYPLPCYANAWLRQYPWYAGTYPSGGPVREVHWIWKLAAPSLFTLAPDIYVPYVADVMDEYSYEGNPLFIPEVRKDSVTSSYCLYAFAKYHAIGYSPFGIEELALLPEEVDRPPMEVMAALNIDPSAFDITGSRDYLSRTYLLLEQIQPLYLKYRGTKKLFSFLKKSDTDYGTFLKCSKYNIRVTYAPKQPAKPLASGMIIELTEDRFLIMGMQSSFTFLPKEGENSQIEVLKMEEGEFIQGEWKRGRILNGDEKMRIVLKEMPGCLMVELFQF